MWPLLQQAGIGERCIFFAVATPGLNAGGHLFRTDGPVVLPLFALRDDALPGVGAAADADRATSSELPA